MSRLSFHVLQKMITMFDVWVRVLYILYMYLLPVIVQSTPNSMFKHAEQNLPSALAKRSLA